MLGTGLADRASQPHCALLPVGCVPDWHHFDALSKTQPGGVRLRLLLDESFRAEARQRGLENRLVVSLVNVVLAGVVVNGALRASVAGSARGAGDPERRVPSTGSVYANLGWAPPTLGRRHLSRSHLRGGEAHGGDDVLSRLGWYCGKARLVLESNASIGTVAGDRRSGPQTSMGNTAEQIATVRVPAGVTVYEGVAAAQDRLVGGGNQVFIPAVDAAWLVQ